MATPSALGFHENSRQYFRKMLDEKLKYNAQRYYKNVVHPSFTGFPKTSTGSWNTPFGWTNDFGKPFQPIPGSFAQGKPYYHVEQVRGGIRSNESYPKVKKLLEQRSRDFEYQNNPELPPTPAPMEVLTADDFLKIELNNALQSLMEFAEGVTVQKISDFREVRDIMRRVAVILAQLSPRFSGSELQDQVGYWNDMKEMVDALLTEKGDADTQWKPTVYAFRDYVLKLQEFITKMFAGKEKSESERVMLAKALLRSLSITQATSSSELRKAVQEGKKFVTETYQATQERRFQEGAEDLRAIEMEGEEPIPRRVPPEEPLFEEPVPIRERPAQVQKRVGRLQYHELDVEEKRYYDSYTEKQLYSKAKNAGLKGSISSLNKAELSRLLKENNIPL